jgi:hypothetical protein
VQVGPEKILLSKRKSPLKFLSIHERFLEQKVAVALIGRIVGAPVTAARRNCLGSSDVKSQTPLEAQIWSFKDVLPQ